MQNNDILDDHFHDECGVFGIFGHKDAATLTALGLHALQHRGQEAAGIVTYDQDTKQFNAHRGLGLVDENFNNNNVIAKLKGNAAIGHNRYATTGETHIRNVQPLYGDLSFGGFAVAHNGNLTNTETLRRELVNRGSLFQSSTDSEIIVHLVALSQKQTIQDRLTDALHKIEGAYSLLAFSSGQMIGVRDPYGIRPLSLGTLDGAYILASETCAFDIIGAEFVRDIEAGEMVIINDQGLQSFKPFAKTSSRFCVFEYIYFARPDSDVEGRSVYTSRKKIGEVLAKESPVNADLVVPVPDSGVPSAIGFAQASGIPFELGIIRNHYVGRTFIEPTQAIRHLGVKRKHNANKSMLDGKSVVLVDDSIVRGTTSKKIVEMVRAAGAKEVHMRISSPPTKNPCFYGIDTPSSGELLANNYTVDEMAKFIGVDSLAFISIDGLYEAMNMNKRDNTNPQFCDACFTNDYPIKITG